ncbi:hypothetical protein BP5796_02797 [Coleophoma crateriformis]|uniref:Uncharacterized protein n=1 Tax=Coleophoma crateriformis TaxID=565419 RepID=A0A3D8SZ92_9HELO|nr:hypothetical protein BP5796_02797 [Coleophoma crateriformis]
MLFLTLFSLALLVKTTTQQKDPLNDFCRRFGHQTAVVDRKLFIDGGLVDWNPISQNPLNYTNTWLLYNDLDTSPAGVGTPQLYANLSKNASIPSVSGGILWPDDVNKRVYLYGGDYYQTPASAYSLLSYDVLNDNWDSFGVPSASVQSVSYGAGVGISDIGEGYMLGGWLSNASVPGWSGSPLATSTLVKYDMDKGAWTNSTGPDTTPRAEGVMVYLPASLSGLLIHFGGLTTPYGNGTIVGSPMSEIHVYDIQSSNWYTQTAVGDVPEMRRRFCAGATWAPDRSSYNIYLYGGAGFDANSTGFDDVYILTLPSFTWIKWWPSTPGTGKPHNTLSCNVIDGAQMIIVGGTFPLSSDCDSPTTWGTHNLDLGKQNSAGAMWHDYQPNLTSYSVPSEIIAVVGGSSLGGATVTAPVSGYDNRDLAVYFTQQASVASRTPTRAIPTPSATQSSSSSSKTLSSGAIAGIAVGAAVVFIAVLIGAWVCIRRRRRDMPKPSPASDFSNVHEQPYPYTPSPNSQFMPQMNQEFHPTRQPHSPFQQPSSIAELAGTTSPRPDENQKFYSPAPNDSSYALEWVPHSATQTHQSPVSVQASLHSEMTPVTELSGSRPMMVHENQRSS